MRPYTFLERGAWSSARLAAEARRSRIGIIIPACDEEACIGSVLEELLGVLDPERYVVAVGVNNSSDRTAEIAARYSVHVAETAQRGYGYGCQAAIELLQTTAQPIGAYVFFAGDGASDPRDVLKLTTAYEHGYPMVLGARTMCLQNWKGMGFSHVLANFSLGLWAGLLGGKWFSDLGPLRLIERRLFETIAPREMTFGWTIEAQIAASLLDIDVIEVPASERRRIAGEQKVSGVTWMRTFSIGCRILAAGWRTRMRMAKRVESAVPLEGWREAQPRA